MERGSRPRARPRRAHRRGSNLPYLRFSRDKRGYENTFVVHTGRRRGKSRSRILYWFRTPPGVRVGRSALDEDAIRLIEQHNPDVEFDWTRILKGQDAPPEPKPTPQPDRRTRPRPREVPAPAPRTSARAAEEPPAAPPMPEQDGVSAIELEAAAELQALEVSGLEVGAGLPRDELLSVELPQDTPLSTRSFADGVLADGPVPDYRVMEPSTAAQARLGFEGLSRLRARHAEVLARISEKVADAAKRDELKSDAERLNPDTWVTDAEVTAGLESYETVFESLRGVVGRRRKRRGRPSGAQGAAGQMPASDTGPGEADSNEPGEDV